MITMKQLSPPGSPDVEFEEQHIVDTGRRLLVQPGRQSARAALGSPRSRSSSTRRAST